MALCNWPLIKKNKDEKKSVCLWVLYSFMVKCVLQYFDPFLNPSENLCNNTLATLLATPPCNPLLLPPPLTTISGGPVLNSIYTGPPSQ